MKKIFLLVLFIPIVSFSQENDFTKDCREFTIKSLMMVYQEGVKKNELNFYIKNDNLTLDAEFTINVSSSKIEDLNIYNKILVNKSQDFVYDILLGMSKSGVFTNSEGFDCKFQYYYFNLTYTTTDYEKSKYTFYVSNQDINKIKDYINKQDVFSILKRI